MIEFAIFLIVFFGWTLMAFAFWKMRKVYLDYRGRWRSAVSIMEEVQVENERLRGERDEALVLSQNFHAFAQKVDKRIVGYEEERENLSMAMNEMIRLQRADREAEVEKQRERLMSKLRPKEGLAPRYSDATRARIAKAYGRRMR